MRIVTMLLAVGLVVSLALTVPASRAEAGSRWSVGFSWHSRCDGPPPRPIFRRGRAFRRGYRVGYRHGYSDGVHTPRVVHYGPPAPVYYYRPAYSAPPVRVITTGPAYCPPPSYGGSVYIRW